MFTIEQIWLPTYRVEVSIANIEMRQLKKNNKDLKLNLDGNYHAFDSECTVQSGKMFAILSEFSKLIGK